MQSLRWFLRHIVLPVAIFIGFLALAFALPRKEAPASVVVVFSGPSHERDSIVAAAARLAGMPVPLAIAVSHTENWGGDSTSRHPISGCLGLMQVCPQIWADSFHTECGTDSLIARWRNACVGAFVAVRYFQACGNWDCALIKYVGAECTSRDTWQRCQKKKATGNQYVRDIMGRLYRTDLSTQRDAMALGYWRAAPDGTHAKGGTPQ